MKKPYLILAYYDFLNIANPHEEVLKHKEFFANRDITCRIYISEQGINGQLSGINADADAYMAWMHSRPEFANLWFKVEPYYEHVFPRATVKYRKQLVAIDVEVDVTKGGERIDPSRWKQMLEEEEHLLLDVRNDYEWAVGHFEGAELPPCETFREFNTYADQLKTSINPKTTQIMMYCTGGIRCELYSAILKEKGFEKVYQLEGGILNYAQQQGKDHWLGRLFVFDDRLAVPMKESESCPVIGHCHHCDLPNETYYNCANADCNELFLCCQDCLKAYAGCCQESCQHAERVRPYQCDHKPFRRMKAEGGRMKGE